VVFVVIKEFYPQLIYSSHIRVFGMWLFEENTNHGV